MTHSLLQSRLIANEFSFIYYAQHAKKEEPTSPLQFNITFEYRPAHLCARWSAGGNTSDVLLYASVSIVDYDTCICLRRFTSTVYKSMLCTSATNGFDSCQGDSGGPVVCAWKGTNYLAGVVSYGSGCADGTPGINTYVSAFTDTINATIDNCVSLAIDSSLAIFVSFEFNSSARSLK